MPWFLNPSAYDGMPLLRHPEFYLFLIKLLVTGIFGIAMWRRGVRGRRLAVGVWVFFFGLFLTVMLAMHDLVILGLRIFERPAGQPFVYDFHLYSLLLLGVVLIFQGWKILRASRPLADGHPDARRETLRATFIVLGLAAALIPIQFFGFVLTAGSLVTIGAVVLLLPSGARAVVPSLTSTEIGVDGVYLPQTH